MNDQIEFQEISNPASDEYCRDLTDALCKLGVCVKNVGLYGQFHTVAEESLINAHDALSKVLWVKPNVVVGVTDSYMVLDSFPLEDQFGSLGALTSILRQRNVSELKIASDITKTELIEFAEILNLTSEELANRGGIDAVLPKNGVFHIQTVCGTLPGMSREGSDPAEIYEEALMLVEAAMKAVQSGLQIAVPEIRSVISDSLQSLTNDGSTLLSLSGIRSYDRYLSEHSVNVCILSMVLGKDLGLDTAATLELGLSAMLHDVGKVFVPSDIAKKPGKLSEEEWQQIRRHPVEGARALASMKDIPILAPTIAMEHHITCDGSGYPSFSAHESTHLLSRLVAIVDTYDALTTDKPYRERWTAEQAIAWMLYEAGDRYDRALLARFASRSNLYPLGSLVKLTTGDIAVVVGGSFKSPRNPKVRIVAHPQNKTEKGDIIDLSTVTDRSVEISAVAQPVEALIPYAQLLSA